MANTRKKVTFKLTTNRKPVSWKVPMNNQMVKKDGYLKKIRYVHGADSMFVEDQKGDGLIPVGIYFEYGILKVDTDNTLLFDIMTKHPRYGKDFILEDKDSEAVSILENQNHIKEALEKVDISSEDKLRANALILIGPATVDWSEKRIRAKMNAMALENSKSLLEQMNSEEYQTKYSCALAMYLKVIEVNETQTAVLWSRSKKPIVYVAAGIDPLEKLVSFLSTNTEEAKVTIQEIGEQSLKVYTKKNPEDIEQIMSDFTGKDVNLQSGSDGSDENPLTLEEARDIYVNLYEVDSVPPNMKNNLEWLKGKIKEKQS